MVPTVEPLPVRHLLHPYAGTAYGSDAFHGRYSSGVSFRGGR